LGIDRLDEIKAAFLEAEPAGLSRDAVSILWFFLFVPALSNLHELLYLSHIEPF